MATYTVTLKELIETGMIIFDFDYDMKPVEHKTQFEELFIRHFFFREIGVETPARFKFQLETELMKLLPYFNKLYMSQGLEQRILDNYDVTETFTRDVKQTANNNSTLENTDQLSDTPVNRININDNDYISALTRGKSNSSNNGTSDNKENWTRKMQGNIGIQTDADAVMKYESSLKNVDMLLLNELDNLFMGVW